ncbi:MAG: hypothetical protein M1837_003147 [Sclerophora amabilis]|nr:MAG: hypothetical protein M1837_003147 [Sclerophora amabilis]
MPYNPGSPIPDQVRASINSSLHNLRSSEGTNPSGDTSYIDCLVLHSPLPTYAETLEAWETFEEFVPHHVRTLGISNTTLPLLEALYDAARVKPSVVQNRFYATTGFDKTLRRFCRDKGIVYQSFWTLTANSQLLNSRPISSLAEAMRIDKAAALYALVLGLGNTVVLDGTSNETRMKADVNAIARLSEWIVLHEREWQNVFEDFKKLINES